MVGATRVADRDAELNTLDLENSDNVNVEPLPIDIEYVYLDFNTDVSLHPAFNDARTKYSACPDLSKYDDPMKWSKTRKTLMTYVSCVNNGVAAYAAGSYAAPEEYLTRTWQVSNVAFNVGLTVFTLGFAIAPMLLAPFSEINGRRPVFILSGLLFVICQLGCALTNTFSGMMAARFFAGVGGSTFSTMVAGILADIWSAPERNTPMVLFTGATIFGTGLGPCVSNYVAQNLLWRWVFYIQIISSGFFMSLVFFFFKETRGPILLAKKARVLNRWYEQLEQQGAVGVYVSLEDKKASPAEIRRIRYRVLAEEQRASIWTMLKISLTRPAKLMVTEPILVCFALWLSLAWGILYLEFAAIPLVFRTNHNFDLAQNGYVFASVSIGGCLSTALSIYQNKWAVQKFGDRFTAHPEGRLWFTCAQGLLMPLGLFMFGWTCYSSIHWIVPVIALVIVTMGIFSIFLATNNYVADVYRIYASSALAGIGVCRNLLAGALPLVVVQMFEGMGFQGASSLLGGLGFLLATGPILLIWFGPRIRLKSRVAKQFIDSDRK